MPVDNKKQELRSVLAGKSIEELEELLTLDFSEQENAAPNVDYITTILEVIDEKEGRTDAKQAETEAAWREFQEYYRLRKQEESLETGTAVEPSHDHRRKTEYRQRPRKYARVLRYCVIAAAAIVLLCGTAFGWNIFQAIADWSTETFYFLTGQSNADAPAPDVYEYLRIAVEKKTDLLAVPTWAPEGTMELGELNVADRDDRHTIGMGFVVDEREFSIRVIIHDTIPEGYSNTYQKNNTIEEEYKSGGITHYIMGNTETLSAMWTNGCVEGYIQGALTLEEMRQMIDSIYKE